VSGAKKDSSSAPASLSMGFSIFEETKPKEANPVKTSSKATKSVDDAKKKPLISKKTTGALRLQEPEVQIDKTTKDIPLTDVMQKGTPTVQETIADFDNEDSTINTKLARFDIDAMFFSPSASDSAVGVNAKNKTTNATKGFSNSENGPNNAASKSIRQQKALPLGVKVEELTGMKDLSAIKETSHDNSMLYGSHFLSTPSLPLGRSTHFNALGGSSAAPGRGAMATMGRDVFGSDDRRRSDTNSLYMSSQHSQSGDSDSYHGV